MFGNRRQTIRTVESAGPNVAFGLADREPIADTIVGECSLLPCWICLSQLPATQIIGNEAYSVFRIPDLRGIANGIVFVASYCSEGPRLRVQQTSRIVDICGDVAVRVSFVFLVAHFIVLREDNSNSALGGLRKTIRLVIAERGQRSALVRLALLVAVRVVGERYRVGQRISNQRQAIERVVLKLGGVVALVGFGKFVAHGVVCEC